MTYPYGSGADQPQYGGSGSGSPDPYGAYSDQPYGGQPYPDQPYDKQAYGEQAYGAHQYGTNPYGSPQYGSPQYGSPQYGSPSPWPQYQQPRTNGMAIGSLVTSLASVVVLGGLTAWIGAVLGHVALGQIKRTGEQGHGMALAGVIIGWVVTGLWVALVVILVIVGITTSNSTST